jgi:hypothetical protein
MYLEPEGSDMYLEPEGSDMYLEPEGSDMYLEPEGSDMYQCQRRNIQEGFHLQQHLCKNLNLAYVKQGDLNLASKRANEFFKRVFRMFNACRKILGEGCAVDIGVRNLVSERNMKGT